MLLFGYKKILHTLIGMGSAALAAACLTQVRRPEFPTREKEVIRNQNESHNKNKKHTNGYHSLNTGN